MKSRFGLFLLAASFLLNLVLLRMLFLQGRPPVERGSRAQPVATVPAAPATPRFQWSQVESTDYPAYIANLRGIGCPERTVREIVAADLDDLFAPRRGPLLATLAGIGVTPPERNQAAAALARLRQDEEALFRKLFGLPAADDQNPQSVAQKDPAPLPQRVRSHQPVSEDTNAAMPLVFQPLDTNLTPLTEDEMEAINRVRESFTAAMGTDLDVNSLEYLHRWQTAQKQADSLLDALLGRQATLKYEAGVIKQADTGSPAGVGN